MEIYRVTKDSPEWQFKAYDYIRTDAFCFGQHIPVEMEFNGDGDRENFNGILVIEDHVPVCGLRISYPAKKAWSGIRKYMSRYAKMFSHMRFTSVLN